MCGIGGVLRLDSALSDTATAAKISRALRHRGPDDEGLWSEGPITLVNRRLSIIGIDQAGHQPLQNEDGSLVVTYNGEIYNYRELRDRLTSLGHIFRSRTDTEVIVHGYEQWGLDRFACELDGMFAFALWDAKLARLVLARDRIGIKPLYVHVTSSQITFASETQALQHVIRGTALDQSSLDLYFALGYVPEPRTVWANVTTVPAGVLRVFEGNRAHDQRYWTLRPGTISAPKSFALGVRRVRDAVRAAVERQVASDVPVGIFLSGGMDSAAVAATMAASSSEPVHAFTLGFHERSYSEVAAASRVAQHFGMSHHTATLGPECWDDVPALASHFGQPFADSSALAVSALSTLASQYVKVVLSGDGGDEVFAGYSTYTATWLSPFYASLPTSVRHAVELASSLMPVSHGKVGVDERLRRFLAYAVRDGTRAHLRWRQFFGPEERHRLLGSESITDVSDVIGYARSASAEFDGIDRFVALDLLSYLPSDMLHKVDVASMMHSLEVRVPMLDVALVELAFSLPPWMKWRPFSGKRILRTALRELLPREVIRGPKRGFNVPIAPWLRGPWFEKARDLLLTRNAHSLYVATDEVERMLNAHRAKTADHGHKLWSLIVFALWCETWQTGMTTTRPADLKTELWTSR